MLVGSGVEHIVGAEGREDVLHTVLLADAGHHGLGLDVGILVLHHQAYVVLGRLSLVDEHHLGGLIVGYLSHHLWADRTCRTRDQHLLAWEQCTHLLHINLYLVAWQQVFNLHLAHLYVFLLVGVTRPLFNIQRYKNLYASIEKEVLQLAVFHKQVVLQWAHHQALNITFANDGSQIFLCWVDLLAHKALIIVGFAVAYIAINNISHRLCVTTVVGDGNGASMCAIHQGVLGSFAYQRALIHQLYADTCQTHDQGRANIHNQQHAEVEGVELGSQEAVGGATTHHDVGDGSQC